MGLAVGSGLNDRRTPRSLGCPSDRRSTTVAAGQSDERGSADESSSRRSARLQNHLKEISDLLAISVADATANDDPPTVVRGSTAGNLNPTAVRELPPQKL